MGGDWEEVEKLTALSRKARCSIERGFRRLGGSSFWGLGGGLVVEDVVEA